MGPNLVARPQGPAACEACQVEGGPGQVRTQVGPVVVVTAAPCVVGQRVGGMAFAIACSAEITNVSRDPVLLAAQSSYLNGVPKPTLAPRQPGQRGLAGFIARLPNVVTLQQFSVDYVGPMRVDPGQAVSLPAPPSGQQWTVVDLNPAAVQTTAWIAGGVIALSAAGTVYGAVKAGQAIARKVRSRR